MTSKYLWEDTSSRGVLLKERVGKDDIKEVDLRVIIIILLFAFLALIVRRREESQEDMVTRSDCTDAREAGEQTGCEKSMSSAYRIGEEEGERGIRSFVIPLM